MKILTYAIDRSALGELSQRHRNQLFGCMFAHDELTFLNRLLMFTQNSVADGGLHDHAQSVQIWCILQLLAGKIFETWLMMLKRVIPRREKDAVMEALSEDHRVSLGWLLDYFGDSESNSKQCAIKIVRNTTAFHYGGLDMERALKELVDGENTIHLAQNPANTLYFLGSAVVFRSIFSKVGDEVSPEVGRSFDKSVAEGVRLVMDDVKNANYHIHQVLYGLIKSIIEKIPGNPLDGDAEETTIQGLPRPEAIGLSPWLDMGEA
ncbi:MAG: hypothetical protein P4L72_02655 [Parvibaculum sp.]|uniref:hypothetical protein n=1 Tax=Parvibaculum sp. TaxID=2024848 RepID=UPI00284AEF5C|nr:hypothetical protein [Parvibaculum sp.]MDR3498110.1 hypothetical protein [Parvibaculum sp.]